MCYHSNKLNIHYLHYIGSQGLRFTSSLRGRRKSHRHRDHFQATLLGFYHTGISSHRDSSTPPAGVLEGNTHDKGELAHMLTRRKRSFTRLSRNVTKSKRMAMRFQPVNQAPSPLGWEGKGQSSTCQPLTRQGSAVLHPRGLVFFPREHLAL